MPATAVVESSAFARFMASRRGRVVRAGIGLALIGSGLAVVPTPAGLAVAGAGLLPLATGVFNLCPIAPLWGGHFLGARYCPSRVAPSPRADRTR